MTRLVILAVTACLALPAPTAAQATNPLWHEDKVKNYLPHMTWPEVRDLLTRTDMVIMPVASLEEHGHQGPLGTDFLNGLERAKLVAQKTDVLVAPILFPGNSPYHMAFPGTITLPAETIQLVYFQAAQSLIRHGFKRFLILNSHGGNQAISRYIVDRINQETAGIAVELGEAAEPFMKGRRRTSRASSTGMAASTRRPRRCISLRTWSTCGVARTAPLTLLRISRRCCPKSWPAIPRQRGYSWPSRSRPRRPAKAPRPGQ